MDVTPLSVFDPIVADSAKTGESPVTNGSQNKPVTAPPISGGHQGPSKTAPPKHVPPKPAPSAGNQSPVKPASGGTYTVTVSGDTLQKTRQNTQNSEVIIFSSEEGTTSGLVR